LEEALGKITAELYMISFEKDLLFLPSEMEKIATTMNAIGKKNMDYLEVKSDYGHDAFLVEIDKIDQYVKDVL